MTKRKVCPVCGGSGSLGIVPCAYCAGSGKVVLNKVVEADDEEGAAFFEELPDVDEEYDDEEE